MNRTLLITLVTFFAGPAFGDDWPQWRGPQRNGISAETDWNAAWPAEGPPIAWSAKVGVGFASFAVTGGRCYTMGHIGSDDVVTCLSAETGEPIWSYAYEAQLDPNLFEGGPTSTPTVSENRVYTFSRRGIAHCLDAATGDEIWSTNVVVRTDAPIPAWGFASSPLVVDGIVVLNAGAAGVGLDADTGEVRWSSDVEDGAYASPVPFIESGAQAALIVSANTLSAVNVASGDVLWSVRWLTRFGVNAADPILDVDRLFISSGYGKGAAMYQLGADDPEQVWRSRELRSQLNPAVLLDGYLYAIHGDTTEHGTLRCLELATGNVMWEHEGTGSGSVIAAAGRLMLLTEDGTLQVGPASPEGFTPTSSAKVIGGKCWTSPVLANGRIYVRNAVGEVVCVDCRAVSAP